MIYACYFVPREGVHPHAKLADYKRMWPIMHDSVRKLGGKLVHITDLHTESWGDETFRVDVSPATTVYSRDVAWAAFVKQLGEGEQAMMVEPDTVMVKPVPPIRDGYDCVILRRPQKCVPGWFRLSKRESAPLYDAVVKAYDNHPVEGRVFHGDIWAVHQVLGIPPGVKAHTIPSSACGVRIEVREWNRYGFRKGSDPYFLQFKGTSKHEMDAIASKMGLCRSVP